tara:strand:- start:3950 stop:4357 length:408 start_codon:yes stop_codon:yes gene_type:complete
LKKTFLILLISKSLTFLAQENTHHVQYESYKLDSLQKKIQKLRMSDKIEVYRIQISSSESHEKIKKIKERYLNYKKNKDVVDEKFETPYFKAVTGLFIDKKNADKELQTILRKFKSAFVFKEEITLQEFERLSSY